MKGGLTLIGGYSGCGGVHDKQRNVEQFVTLLSGDLNGDDDTTGDNSENAYTVVSVIDVLEAATIDGFSIAHGNVNFPVNDPDAIPAPNLTAGAVFGGGIDTSASLLTINHCNIYDNYALSGGGISNTSSAINISNTRIHNNSADIFGGGVDCFVCNYTINDSEISFNKAKTGGGGDFSSGALSLERVIVRGNRASELPGSEAGVGGGLRISNSFATINNSLVVDNRAAVGGAIFLSENHIDISNSTIVRNVASNKRVGGGICIQGGTIDITNSIVWDNRGGIGTTLITTQIDWGTVSSRVAYSHNDIELWNASIERNLGSIGNFTADPQFIDDDGVDDIPGTADDDFRLSINSPCINSGDPTLSLPDNEADLDGNARAIGCRTDIGAYESTKQNMPGDYDADDQLTLSDYAQFQLCFDAMTSTSVQAAVVCTCIFDTDSNDVFDLADLPGFIEMFNGLTESFGVMTIRAASASDPSLPQVMHATSPSLDGRVCEYPKTPGAGQTVGIHGTLFAWLISRCVGRIVFLLSAFHKWWMNSHEWISQGGGAAGAVYSLGAAFGRRGPAGSSGSSCG